MCLDVLQRVETIGLKTIWLRNTWEMESGRFNWYIQLGNLLQAHSVATNGTFLNAPIPLREHHQLEEGSVDCHGLSREFWPIIGAESWRHIVMS